MKSVELKFPLAVSSWKVGVRLVVRPVEETFALRNTNPVNPSWLRTIIVEAEEEPARIGTVAGEALRVKSWITAVIMTEWTVVPLTPVIVMVYVPGWSGRMLSVDVAFSLGVSSTLVGFRVAAGPDGATATLSRTVPVNPKPRTVTVQFPTVPLSKFRELVLVCKEKSGRTVTFKD